MLKKFIFSICILIGLTTIATSDVIFMQNGTVFIGDFVGPSETGLDYSVFGKKVTLAPGTILKSTKNLADLADKTLAIELKDGSLIKGKIADFDIDVGLFLDIGFGVLTIPVEAIGVIFNPQLKKRFDGTGADILIGGGVYFPIGDSATFFAPSYLIDARFSTSISSVRGLRLGLGISYRGADYVPNDTTQYLIAEVFPSIEFQILDLRLREDFLRIFTPFVGLSAGVTYIKITDAALLPPSAESLTASVSLNLGLDIEITPEIYARLGGFSEITFQTSKSFINVGAELLMGLKL